MLCSRERMEGGNNFLTCGIALVHLRLLPPGMAASPGASHKMACSVCDVSCQKMYITYQRKRKGCKNCKDLISSLTDDILVRILSLLDPREATRTSVLSTRWRYVWVKVPDLNFGASSTLYPLRNARSISKEHHATQYKFEACEHVPRVDQVVSLSNGTVGSTFTGVSAGSTFSSKTIGATSASSSVGSTFSYGTVVADSVTIGALLTGMESEVTSTMFETYCEPLDAVARHKAEHDSLLKKREFLVNGIKEISEVFEHNGLRNVGLALSGPFTELLAVIHKIQELELDYDKKVDMMQKLPSGIASESLLALKSGYHFPWNYD